ncbi:uncharacterized protein A1O5_09764 [Cladophialophora psammophila CBS 110553]|uniref:ZZ-type domain-containing protein n=1 Tax=Cladophialophora psammophila CBS 110553 TaxID=1182543 RepID=W9WG73_9EURO|nr:uncharacterized protein A1O5_09764 [Cladophialophora psammophila CBS 110553]EXJ67117.1 hypothetical protein A1O5_09764 [Cladophialophora psammophila CBS 110553]
MATPHPHIGPVGPDTLITIKVIIDGTNRRFKLALRDLGANVLPQKLRTLLAIPPEQDVRFDRFSDSQARYITLDSNDPAIYKQLYRAAKAKLKLRLRATVEGKPARDSLAQDIDMAQNKAVVKDGADSQPEPRNNFLETVLSQPVGNSAAPPFKAFQKTCQYSPKCAIPGAFDLDVNTFGTEQAVNNPQGSQSDVYSLPTLPSMNDFPSTSYTIDCNHCGMPVPDEHYHCGICEGGDFDLCKPCIDAGITCDGDEHWLLKRTIRNGIVVTSTTETLPPKKLSKAAAGSSSELTTPISPEHDDTELTCNSCISQMPAREFVTCQECPDYDLCLSCMQDGEHGHDPSHSFEARDPDALKDEPAIKALCGPGRGVRHEAICDGCDQAIYGIRHKCLTCPDFDYCSACFGFADEKHPGHRFAPIYVPIKVVNATKHIHRGIYCDGPLCTSYKRYITGDRYKCAVCHDTDFCANCEAWPNNPHNPSHPLIKFRQPIRHVSIRTHQENELGQQIAQSGDRPMAKNAATETTRSTSANAATQVQTVAEVDPVETAPAMVEIAKADNATSASPVTSDLQAWYVTDSTPDGSRFPPNHFISQSWTLRNPGPEAWPAGCAVYYIGGDDMRNLDVLHPSSTTAMAMANRSNALASPVEPGKTGVFTVLLKSPAREGRAISYWRLKTPGGISFGHKLWVDIEVRSTPVELPIRSHILPPTPVTLETVDEPKEGDGDTSQGSSTMIFPKLEKESPISSVHDVREAQVEEAPAAVMEPTIKTEEHELLEDVESLELEESNSDEDGFLTDEEYDILDASDEDLLMDGQTSRGK